MKKIVLIGDSIRQGYDKYVKMAFDGVAQVFYPNENCRFSSYILRHLQDWKDQMNCGDDVDLVHWNAGLWDSLIMLDGKHHTSVDNYKENIQRLCNIIKILFPKAKIIFATSTPVREELFLGPCKRYNLDVEAYNVEAVDALSNNGVIINDLYSLVKDFPEEYYSDMTHLRTKEGTKLLVEKVVNIIEDTLNIEAKKIDYGTLFIGQEKITGM